VSHPNVAQVHDILEMPSGVPFIVMDLLVGEPLSGRVARRGKLTLAEAIRVLVPVIDAVEAAHALGIVHRDLKPDNVFLERGLRGEDVVKALDFGIAKTIGTTLEGEIVRSPRAVSSLTTTYSAVGTPSYMAPEQLEGSQDVDARADTWALGIIAIECLTGERPLRGLLGELDLARVREALTAVVAPESASIVDVIVRMVAPARDDRPTLSEVRAAFASSGVVVVAPDRRSLPPPRSFWGPAIGVAAVAVMVFGFAFTRSPEPSAVVHERAAIPPLDVQTTAAPHAVAVEPTFVTVAATAVDGPRGERPAVGSSPSLSPSPAPGLSSNAPRARAGIAAATRKAAAPPAVSAPPPAPREVAPEEPAPTPAERIPSYDRK
jgi:serine/threonine-protein kinase